MAPVVASLVLFEAQQAASHCAAGGKRELGTGIKWVAALVVGGKLNRESKSADVQSAA